MEFSIHPDEIKRIYFDHFHNDEGCLAEYLIRKTLETGTIQNSIFKIQDKNGCIKYFNAFAFPMYDNNKNFSNIIEISWNMNT